MEGNSSSDFSVGHGIGEVEGYLVGNFRWTPVRICAPSFSDFEGLLVGNWDDDVLRQSYGGLIGR